MESEIEVIWKVAEGIPKYECSNTGLIRNIKTQKKLKQQNRNGYLSLYLNKKTISVHIIVAKLFVENLHDKPYVNHLDGNKHNNLYSNLEWVTPKENVIHSVKNNLIIPYMRCVNQLTIDNEFIKEFESITLAASTMNCSRRAIDLVCNNINKTAKGFKWEYTTKVKKCDIPETAKDIINFPQYYIDKDGKVYSKRSKKELKPQKNKSGYLWIQFSVNSKKQNFYIHRLTAIHFIDNPYNKPYVNHIDGNKTNNHVNNLEWVTNSENMIHYINHTKMHSSTKLSKET